MQLQAFDHLLTYPTSKPCELLSLPFDFFLLLLCRQKYCSSWTSRCANPRLDQNNDQLTTRGAVNDLARNFSAVYLYEGTICHPYPRLLLQSLCNSRSSSSCASYYPTKGFPSPDGLRREEDPLLIARSPRKAFTFGDYYRLPLFCYLKDTHTQYT